MKIRLYGRIVIISPMWPTEEQVVILLLLSLVKSIPTPIRTDRIEE